MLSALQQAWADGSWGRYQGDNCLRLTKQLTELHGLEFVTLCSSGTIAVELALRGLGVAAGDEVLLAGYDFPGNFRSIEAIGARPVLVDIHPANWCLDPQLLAAAVGPCARAILVSHLHGGMAPMQRITEFARSAGLKVVEDACQAPGARIDGRIAGTWGDAGVLSFGGSKLLTAGRGGAVLTRDADVHQRTKIFSQRGNDAFPLSELQAAVLLPQLDRLATRNNTRRQRVHLLLDQLKTVACLRPLQNLPGAEPAFYKLAWEYLPSERATCTREQFVTAAAAEGLALDVAFRGFARRSGRRCRASGELPVSRQASESTVILHHPVLLESEDVIKQAAKAVQKVAAAYQRS